MECSEEENIMANEVKTFTLKDLDAQFWEKVILVKKENSSGLGGSGYLELVTSDKKMYFMDFDNFPYGEHKLEMFSPLFKPKEKIEDYKHPYAVEGNGWHYIPQGQILVRDDFYEKFISEYNAAKMEHKNLFASEIAGVALGVEGKLERFDLEESV